ncbi:MAG: aldolase/citrate lyase family protein [Acuticoccus sp.]
MSNSRPHPSTFAPRLRQGAHLRGTFVKTPTSHATEMLGAMGFDFVVFDMEHAPIDLGALDVMLLAARAANVAGVVRVAEGTPAAILSVLDAGASGILVPHVDSAEKAATIVAASRYAGGKRGFANTTRAGGYGAAGFRDHMAAQDESVAVVAMIEDLAAVDRLDAILAVDGLDAVFIGRGDLTAALGEDAMTSEATRAVTEQIMAGVRRAAKPAILLCADRADLEDMAGLGATAFMVGSDHAFMTKAARDALAIMTPPVR